MITYGLKREYGFIEIVRLPEQESVRVLTTLNVVQTDGNSIYVFPVILNRQRVVPTGPGEENRIVRFRDPYGQRRETSRKICDYEREDQSKNPLTHSSLLNKPKVHFS